MSHPRFICQSSIAACVLALLSTTGSAQTSYYWDPGTDGDSTIGGAGIWNTTNLFWDPTATDTTVNNIAWPNTGNDAAVFAGTGGAVTLGSAISTNKLIFSTAGYTLSGGTPANTLTLAGTTPTITATADAAISAALGGTAGLLKDGAGTLTLSGTNTYGGLTSVTAGALSFGASNNLGGAAAGNSLAVSNNAILRFTGTAATDLTANRVLAIGTGGATINQTGTGILTLSGVVSGAAGNALTKIGTGILQLGAVNTFAGGLVVNGGTLRLTNTSASTFSGGITVNAGGTLEANVSGADNTAFNNTFGAATNSFTLNGGRFLSNATDRTITGRSFTIGAGGGTFEITGTSYTNFVETGTAQVRLTTTTLSGSGTLTKNGAGRLTANAASAGFTGAVIINNGTVEAGGPALGNASATNTVTVNGGNWALAGDASQAITLNGGAVSTNGTSRTLNGTVNVTSDSYAFLNEFWRDFDSTAPTAIQTRNLTLTGVLSGSAAFGVAVNRAGWTSNNGSVILKNSGNTYSGTITVGKNLRLENNATAGFGKTLGTASIVLEDAGLNLRDNGNAGGQTGTVFNYGNNISTAAPSAIFDRGTLAGSVFIDVNRASGTVAANNTFRLGSLSLDRPLTVTGGNGYAVEFGGASTFTGNAVLNTTTASLAFSGGFTEDAAGRSLTKTGAGALTFTSQAAYTGATTVTGGALNLSGTGGALVGTPSIAITDGSLNIDNSAAALANRVPDTAPVSLSNSSITFSSLAATATNASETIGAVSFSTGANTITVNQGNAGAISALTVGSLNRQNTGTLRLIGTNLGQAGNSSRILLANQTTDVPFLGAWVTINGTDFAQYVSATDSGMARGITAADYVTDPADDSGFTATQNLRLTGTSTTTLTANRTVNTVNFANAANTRTLALGANTLTLAGGGILVGTNSAAITATGSSGITSGTPDLIVTNNAALDIGAAIKDNSGAVAVTKTGTGTLSLTGANTFTGDLRVQQGSLSIADVADTGTASNIGAGSAVYLSDSGAATLQFTGASDTTNRALTIAAPGATIGVSTAASTLTWSGAVTGNGPLTKTGTGKLSLTGNSNLSSATVATGNLTFGGTATITGDLNVGIDGSNGTTNNSTGTPASVGSLAGGSLAIGSGSANSLNIGGHFLSGNNSYGSADFSNLTTLTINVGNVRVGFDNSSGTGLNAGILKLGQTSTITATTAFTVGDSGSDATNGGLNVATPGQLVLGSTANTITTPNFVLGGRKYNSSLSIPAGSTPTFTLNNGAGRVALNIGANTIGTGSAPADTFDLGGANFQASLGVVLIGLKNGGLNGGVTATANFGTNPATNVNSSVSTGQALTVGRLDFATGYAAPTANTAATVGTLTIAAGTHTYASTDSASSAVLLGYLNNSAGAATLPAFTTSVAGTLVITGGNVTINSAGTASAINVAPRTVQGTPGAAANATGTLTISGGSVTVNNQITGNDTTSAQGGSTSTLNLSGGVLNMSGKTITGFTNLNFTGGTLRNLGAITRGTFAQAGETSLLDVAANNTTITGAYSVTDGDVNVAATRTLNVSGGTIASGTANVLVNGALQGSLTVNTGATVTGSGSTQALAIAGGRIAPGTGAGTLSTGDLTLGGGTLALEINGATAGSLYDQLNVTGTVSLTANTNFTLNFGYIPAVGQQFVLINNDSTDSLIFSNGALLAFNGGAGIADDATFTTPQGMQFQLDYNGGVNGNDVVLTTVVPEPTSIATLCGGLGTLVGLQRFRRRR